jgi:hypothetical protein
MHVIPRGSVTVTVVAGGAGIVQLAGTGFVQGGNTQAITRLPPDTGGITVVVWYIIHVLADPTGA